MWRTFVRWCREASAVMNRQCWCAWEFFSRSYVEKWDLSTFSMTSSYATPFKNVKGCLDKWNDIHIRSVHSKCPFQVFVYTKRCQNSRVYRITLWVDHRRQCTIWLFELPCIIGIILRRLAWSHTNRRPASQHVRLTNQSPRHHLPMSGFELG